jgi:methyl coenzyme M reductase alpha subunit
MRNYLFRRVRTSESFYEYFTREGTYLIPEKRVCDLIDEIRRKGVASSSEISRVLERDNGIEVPPHIIAEYKYRERRRRFLGESE